MGRDADGDPARRQPAGLAEPRDVVRDGATEVGVEFAPPRIRTFDGAAGGGVPVCPLTTNSVMVCGGSVAERVPFETDASASRPMLLLEESRHTWTAPCAVKPARRKFTDGLTDRSLLIAMIVSA